MCVQYCTDFFSLPRYGFNSVGVDKVEERLKTWRISRTRWNGILGANLGKNKDTVEASDDFTVGLRKLGPHVDYVVVNVSSPNTPGLRDYQKQNALKEVISRVCVCVHACACSSVKCTFLHCIQ